MTIEIQGNDVLEKVFDDAADERSLDRISVQRELLALCEDESEKRDLLIYLARTRHVHVADIICDIKRVDHRLAMTLRHEESARWEALRLAPMTLQPVFSAS